MIDLDRLNRDHVIGVRFNSKTNTYNVVLTDRTLTDVWEISWQEWMNTANQINTKLRDYKC